MAIQTTCPHAGCGQKYRVEESHAGQTVVCRSCGRQFTVAATEHETRLSAQDADTRSPQHQADAPEKQEKAPNRLGRFEIRSRLGAGAFGAVYRAHDPVLDREVALKIPRASALEHPEAKARFLREPKAAAKLSHPNIVPVYDAGSDGDQFYIASAFIEGRTLKAVLEEDPPELRGTAPTVRHLADALAYAHRRGVVHRDAKPANVMLDAAGQPLLMDFGLARLVSSTEEKLTQDGTVMGTPAYMAPEQADGSLGEVGPAADQYSLGVVLYEMLCGETPFTGPPTVVIFDAIHKTPDPPRTKVPSIPRDLETICLKAMSKRAVDRYASCGHMAEDLRRWLADEPILARRSGYLERAAKWARREPFLAGLGLSVAILAVASTILAAGFFASRQEMARAVEYEEEQTALAESETARAEEQARLAQEQERLAAESEKSARVKQQAAKAALAKLETEVKARNEAEAAAKAEADRRGKMTEEVRQKESKITETTAAVDLANRQLKDAQEAQKPFLTAAAWKAYIERLSAADKAYQKKDTAAALQLLEKCPADQRSWEWSYLKMLCDDKTPVETDIPGVPWGGLVVSSNLRFACNRAAGGNTFRIVELPDLKPAAEVRLTGEIAKGTWYLSPAGNAILAQATASDWFLVNLSDGKRTPLHDKTPVGPFSFSPDGTYVLLREWHVVGSGASMRTRETEKTVVLPIASPDAAVDIGPARPAARRMNALLADNTRLWLWTLADDQFLSVLSVNQTRQPGSPILIRGTENTTFAPSTPLEFVALSPDGRRVLVHDPAKGRFALFHINAQQQLPRLKFLPWESYGAIELQMNAEWTRAIMAKQGPISSVHCWSIAHHLGEK